VPAWLVQLLWLWGWVGCPHLGRCVLALLSAQAVRCGIAPLQHVAGRSSPAVVRRPSFEAVRCGAAIGPGACACRLTPDAPHVIVALHGVVCPQVCQ
jgi:hypothetical protein